MGLRLETRGIQAQVAAVSHFGASSLRFATFAGKDPEPRLHDCCCFDLLTIRRARLHVGYLNNLEVVGPAIQKTPHQEQDMKQAGPMMTNMLEATLHRLVGSASNREDTDNC